MLTKLESVVLAVQDLPSAVAGYSRLFGYEPSLAEAAGEIRRARFALVNSSLDLVTPAVPEADSWLSHWLAKRGEGPVGLVFGCGDVDEEALELEGRGLATLDEVAPVGVALEPENTRGVPVFLNDRPLAADLPERAPHQVYGLDHAVVRTARGDAARSFYEQGLGLRVALDRSFEQWNARLIFCRVGGVTVEIAAALPEKEENGGVTDELPQLDRLWGFTWQVADADAARARLFESGIEVSEVRDGRKPGTRVFTVRSGTCETPTLVIEPTKHPPK